MVRPARKPRQRQGGPRRSENISSFSGPHKEGCFNSLYFTGGQWELESWVLGSQWYPIPSVLHGKLLHEGSHSGRRAYVWPFLPHRERDIQGARVIWPLVHFPLWAASWESNPKVSKLSLPGRLPRVCFLCLPYLPLLGRYRGTRTSSLPPASRAQSLHISPVIASGHSTSQDCPPLVPKTMDNFSQAWFSL